MKPKKVSFSDFSHSLPISVSWGDMDALGHINNIFFFRYFEDVRVSWLAKNDIRLDPETGVGVVLADISCKFIRPIYYPANIIAACSIHSVKEDRFSMNYGLFSEKDYNCLAVGDSVIKAFSFKDHTKVNLPESWLEVLERE